MKKILLLISLLVFSGTGNAQSPDSIPNAGFEDWIWVGWNDNPIDWVTNNSQLLASTVVMDTNRYSGNYAMKLINAGAFRPLAWCRLMLNHHPLALFGYLKNNLQNGDTALINVYLYKNGLLVDSGYQYVTAGINTNYYSFSVPVSQNSVVADSAVIQMNGGTQYLSEISFDDLSFTFPSGIEGVHQTFYFTVGPNPVHDLLTIDLSSHASQSLVSITLLDASGKKIIDEKFERQQINFSGTSTYEINMQQFAAGVYFLDVRVDRYDRTLRIVKD